MGGTADVAHCQALNAAHAEVLRWPKQRLLQDTFCDPLMVGTRFGLHGSPFFFVQGERVRSEHCLAEHGGVFQAIGKPPTYTET